MAWASRMATMAALLTATSGVVLVNDWETGDKCCISKNAIKDISPWLGCRGVFHSWWEKGPQTCEAVNSNLETYKELQKCVWKHYWIGTAGEEDKIDVVFSGIRTIDEAAVGGTAPDCVELFKRVYTAAEAEVEPNIKRSIVAGAAYQKLLIEAMIDATKGQTDTKLLKNGLDEILKKFGHSKDSHIVERTAEVEKLVSNLKEKMGEGDTPIKDVENADSYQDLDSSPDVEVENADNYQDLDSSPEVEVDNDEYKDPVHIVTNDNTVKKNPISTDKVTKNEVKDEGKENNPDESRDMTKVEAVIDDSKANDKSGPQTQQTIVNTQNNQVEQITGNSANEGVVNEPKADTTVVDNQKLLETNKTKASDIKADIVGNPNGDSTAENVKVPERDQKEKHGCMHRIKRALGLTAKTFARAIRHQLHALQE